MEITVFIALNLSMLFSSHLIAYRYSRESNFSLLPVATFLVYVSQITCSILFLGVVVKNLDSVFIVILNAVVSSSVIFIYRRFIKDSVFEPYKKAGLFFKYIFKTGDIALYVLLFLFTVQVVTVIVKMHYLPPHVWDVLVYHLHPVMEWIQQNQIPSFIDTPSSHVNFFPLGSKLIHFWFIKFSGETTWIELPQFIYSLMLIPAAYAIMRKISIQKKFALKYALLIYFIPSVLIESRTSQDHLALTVIILITALYFIDSFFPASRNPGQKAPVVFPALALGLLLGSKISAPVIICVFFTALLFSKGYNHRKVYEFLIQNRWNLSAGLLLILMLGGYWHLKSGYTLRLYSHFLKNILTSPFLWTAVPGTIVLFFLLRKGFKRHGKIILAVICLVLLIGGLAFINNMDILTPFLTGHTSPEPLLSSKSFNNRYPLFNSTFMKNILSFPFRIKDIGEYSAYSAGLLKMSGFGVQFFALGMIAYLVTAFLVIARKNYRNGVVGFIFILSALMLASYYVYYYSRANYRLFMFFPVFGIILWAFVSRKLDLQTYYLKVIDVLIIVMVLFNMAACFYEGNPDGRRWKTLFTLDDPLERTAIKYSHFLQPDEWKFLDRYTLPGEPVGYFGRANLSAFAYFDNRMKRKIHYLQPLGGFTLAAAGRHRQRLVLTPKFMARLKERNIHYIHIHTRKIRTGDTKESRIFIDDPRVIKVTGDLYYFKWKGRQP